MKYSQYDMLRLANRVFSRFVLADIAFSFLPIAITAVILRTVGELKVSFLTTPEWSFVAIIIYGLAMTRTLELKIHYQKDYSENVFALTRVCILGLVASTVSLALAQMQMAGLHVSTKCVLIFQFAVLSFGILILSQVHLAREKLLMEWSRVPRGLPLKQYLKFIVLDLEDSRDDLDNLVGKFERKDTCDPDNVEQTVDRGVWVNRKIRYIDYLLVDLENCTRRLKEARVGWKAECNENEQEKGTAVYPRECEIPVRQAPGLARRLWDVLVHRN